MKHRFQYKETIVSIVCEDRYLRTAQDAIF